MNFDNWIKIIEALSPFLTALFGVGGFAAYWEYKTRKPVTNAEAAKTLTGTEISVGEAWQRYAMNIDARFTKVQQQYDELYTKFEMMRISLSEKDAEIVTLRKRVADLEAELSKYRGPLDGILTNGTIKS